MGNNYEKAIKMTLALLCGTIAFSITYYTLGVVFIPVERYIEHYIEEKLKGVN